MSIKPGISNRESADEEARERADHPPLNKKLTPVEDVAGRSENPEDLVRDAEREARAAAPRDLQTSHKAGVRSLAQKESETRHPSSVAPAARKVAGAFGKEPVNRSRGGGSNSRG
jgi:hypothetical protein